MTKRITLALFSSFAIEVLRQKAHKFRTRLFKIFFPPFSVCIPCGHNNLSLCFPRFFAQVRRWLHHVVTFVLRLACWHEPLSASPVAIQAARTAASSLVINVEEVSAASMSSSSSSSSAGSGSGSGTAGGGAGAAGSAGGGGAAKSGSGKGSSGSSQAEKALAKAAAEALELAANTAEQGSSKSAGLGSNSSSSGGSNNGADTGLHGNEDSYLVALDAYVAARVGMIGRGIG